MRNVAFAFVSSFMAYYLIAAAQAQTIQNPVRNIALKSGETVEITDLYYIGMNCQSLLKGTPVVEIMEGPPGVTAAINAQNVVPRIYGCAKAVTGGKLSISAKDIDDQSLSRLVLRIKYKTSVGDRESSVIFNVALFPAN